MILHVARLDKFIPSFVNLVKEEFQGEDHKFWFTGSLEQYPVKLDTTIYLCESGRWNILKGYMRLIKQLHQARKVVVHGLFEINVVILLALCPWELPKCYWVIWGGDLYQYTKATTAWRSRISESVRRLVIRRIGHLITYIDGDVELARKWYGAKGIQHECIMYMSNVVDPRMAVVSNPNPNLNQDGLNILLGNSADPSNNHIEALERLLPYKDRNIKIYAPLSYGDQDHAKEVISQGQEWFGEKFVPMTDFMPFEQYLEFLKSLDIAIFNHQRQQAMGNTITLLGMGKTVFMRGGGSHWRFLGDLGIKLNCVADLTLQRLEFDEAEGNARVIRSYFSRATLIKQLSGIFEE